MSLVIPSSRTTAAPEINWQDPLNKELVGWWPFFLQTGGGTVRNLVKRRGVNDAIIQNHTTVTPDWDIASDGPSGGAYRISSLGDRLEVADPKDRYHPIKNQADLPFTVAVWVKCESFGSGKGGICAKYPQSTPFEGSWSFLFTNSGAILFQCVDRSTTRRIRQDTNSTLNTNQWYHIVAKNDGTAVDEAITIYVDGKIAPSTGGGGDATYIQLGGNNGNGYDSPLEIGSTLHESTYYRYLNGSISDLRIWYRDLKDDEVAELYQASRQGYPNQLRQRSSIVVSSEPAAFKTYWASQATQVQPPIGIGGIS